MSGDLVLSEQVLGRMDDVRTYLLRMRLEREGWGMEAMQEVADTMDSWIWAQASLFRAVRVWTDGATRPLDCGKPELSFGGDFTGTGFQFGVISRVQSTVLPNSKYPPIQWSTHS